MPHLYTTYVDININDCTFSCEVVFSYMPVIPVILYPPDNAQEGWPDDFIIEDLFLITRDGVEHDISYLLDDIGDAIIDVYADKFRDVIRDYYEGDY